MDRPLVSFPSFPNILEWLDKIFRHFCLGLLENGAACSSSALTGIRYGSFEALQLKFGCDNFIENMFCAEKIALLPSYLDYLVYKAFDVCTVTETQPLIFRGLEEQIRSNWWKKKPFISNITNHIMRTPQHQTESVSNTTVTSPALFHLNHLIIRKLVSKQQLFFYSSLS